VVTATFPRVYSPPTESHEVAIEFTEPVPALRGFRFASVTRKCARLAPGVVFLLGVSTGVRALEGIVLEAGPVAGHAWSLQHLVTRLEVREAGSVSVSVEATGVRLPKPLDGVRSVRAICGEARLTSAGFGCRGGAIEIDNAAGLPSLKPAGFDVEYGQDGFRLRLDGLRLGNGVLRVDLEAAPSRWSLSAKGEALPVAAIAALAGIDLADSKLQIQSGVASGTVRWVSSADAGQLGADLRLRSVSFSDAAGLNAGEDVALDVSIEASRQDGPWKYRLASSLGGGLVYFDPVFIDAGAAVIRAQASGSWAADTKRLDVDTFAVRHEGIAALAGRAALRLEEAGPRLEALALETETVALDSLHATYVKPWLADSAFAGLELKGDMNAVLSWRHGGPAEASVRFSNLDLDDRQARFGVLGVDAEIHWRDAGVAEPTRLSWKGAHFYRIDLGGGDMRGQLSGSGFRLTAPVSLPLLGGALRIGELEAEGLGAGPAAWKFSGELTPISLEELTNRLAWPPFSGSVSGVVPAVRYANDEISIEGSLTMRAFDGLFEIGDLKLEQPFGVIPRVTADVVVTNLSLDALTRTFSFGSIQGRLSGRVRNLVLENWRPAAFEAEFATPEDDTSRHRISQRAVENLARLGGAGRVLSSTMLRFLQSFSYERLGMSCRLRNGVCKMGGVEPGERGYYIVKGGGLPPRIDVFGFNTRVDWNTLLERLKAVTRADQAVVR